MGTYYKIEDTGSATVEVWIKKMKISDQKSLKTNLGNVAGDPARNRLISDINFGLIENIVLDYCLERLRVNDRECKVVAGDPLQGLPEIDDDDYMLNTDDGIMRAVVKENRVLWKNPRFARAFGEYAPEDEPVDEADPTTPEDTSTSGPSPVLEIRPPNQPETPPETNNETPPTEESSKD